MQPKFFMVIDADGRQFYINPQYIVALEVSAVETRIVLTSGHVVVSQTGAEVLSNIQSARETL